MLEEGHALRQEAYQREREALQALADEGERRHKAELLAFREEIHRNHFAFREAYRLLEKGGLTYYSDEAEDFSAEHRRALRRAGFRDLQREICEVTPSKGCHYWQERTHMVPIVFK